uniref:FYVE-type domain-containing protein n=1 Tax=Trichuris muris TaxID=70415 RepID=A0A5S6QBR0_TRIMR
MECADTEQLLNECGTSEKSRSAKSGTSCEKCLPNEASLEASTSASKIVTYNTQNQNEVRHVIEQLVNELIGAVCISFDSLHSRRDARPSRRVCAVDPATSCSDAKLDDLCSADRLGNSTVANSHFFVENSESADSAVSSSGATRLNSTLGATAPEWVPDDEWRVCMQCENHFTLIKRRHHCRACGRVLCSDCCNMRAKLPYMDGKTARVCQQCACILNQEDVNEPVSAGPIARSGYPLPADEASSRASPHLVTSAPCTRASALKKPGASRQEAKTVTFADGVCPGESSKRAAKEPTVGVLCRALVSSSQVNPVSSQEEGSGEKVDRRARERESFLPELERLPVVTFNDGSVVSEEHSLPDLLKDGVEVSFHLKRNLQVNVQLSRIGSQPGKRFWRFVTHGMCNTGKMEVVILLERLGHQILPPYGMFPYLDQLYNKFLEDSFVTSDLPGGVCFVDVMTGKGAAGNFGFLGNRENAGFVYFLPTEAVFDQLHLSKSLMLVGLLIHRSEVIWAEVLPLRLLLRIGFACNVYPWPVTSQQVRASYFGETGHTVMSLLNDLRNFTYSIPSVSRSTVTIDGSRVEIRISEDSYEQIVRVLNTSNEHVVAWACDFCAYAHGHLACVQDSNTGSYVAKRLSLNSTPVGECTVIGCSFVIFNASLKSCSQGVRSSIVEDGVMVQLHLDSVSKLCERLRNREDFSLQGEATGEQSVCTLNVSWTKEPDKGVPSFVSLIDKTELKLKYRYNVPVRLSETFTAGKLVRLTDVFLLPVQPGCEPTEPESFFTSYRRISAAVEKALFQFWDELLAVNIRTICVRMHVGLDLIDYKFGAGDRPLPSALTSVMNDLIAIIVQHELANLSVDWKAEFVFRLVLLAGRLLLLYLALSC